MHLPVDLDLALSGCRHPLRALGGLQLAAHLLLSELQAEARLARAIDDDEPRLPNPDPLASAQSRRAAAL